MSSVEVGELLLERYRLVSELGRGGNGLVFEALDEQLGRGVALKVLHPLQAGDPNLRARFEKESRLLARLAHPGIVTIRAFEEDRARKLPVLVMDLVPGRDLGELLDHLRAALEREEHRTFPESQDGQRLARALGGLPSQDPRPSLTSGTWFRIVARIGREIVRVLEAAHGSGVIHRDLTPRNVMIGPGGWPVILDFGLGGVLGVEPGAVTQSLHGTPGYIAPEQLGAQQTGSDPRTDVYQVGLLLYELLTLQPAFARSGSVGSVLDHVRRGLFATPRELNRAVPPGLEAICLRAMELDPERRYSSVFELGRDLDRWLEGLVPFAGGTGWTGKVVRALRYGGRRHPRLTSAAAAGLAVSLIAAAALPFFSGRRPLIRIDGAWRFVPGAERPSGLDSGEPVRPGDWLGVQVDSDVPAVIYGLTLVGGATPEEQYVLPVREPRSLRGFATAALSEPAGSWGLRVLPGRTDVALVEAREERGEGLLVIAGADRMPDVESWFDRMSSAHERSWPAFPGIPRNQAEALIAGQGDIERGKPLSELSPEERAERTASIDLAAVLEGAGWDTSLGARLEVWFPVRPD